jgi:hypothetical protein
MFVLCIFVYRRAETKTNKNTQHKHRKPTGQPGMGSCKHWTQYTERRQTKIHNTNIENRRDNQEWAAVNIGHNTQHDDKQNKIHNTNIENQKHK